MSTCYTAPRQINATHFYISLLAIRSFRKYAGEEAKQLHRPSSLEGVVVGLTAAEPSGACCRKSMATGIASTSVLHAGASTASGKICIQHFADDPDMENLILDSTVIRAHPCAAGALKKRRPERTSARSQPRWFQHQNPRERGCLGQPFALSLDRWSAT